MWYEVVKHIKAGPFSPRAGTSTFHTFHFCFASLSPLFYAYSHNVDVFFALEGFAIRNPDKVGF